MSVTVVTYAQLGPTRCIRETTKNVDNSVSHAVDVLDQIDIPMQVQRIMGMIKRSVEPDPTVETLSRIDSAEYYRNEVSGD